jgi:hypothetical protein
MKLLKTAIPLMLLLCGSLHMADAQITQASPDLCGLGGPVRIPDGISIIIIQGQGTALLTMTADHQHTIQLPGVQDEIAEVCPISSDRLLIFGSAAGAYNVVIFDRKHETVADSFYAYDPKVSPDQRWLVSRSFYPAQSDVIFSEEYVLYDLNKSAEKKLNTTTQQASEAERVIYPIVDGGGHFERTALPSEQTHRFCSEAFYWSPDSRFVLFGDCMNHSLSVVLADALSQLTRVHSIHVSAECNQLKDSIDSLEIRVTNMEFEQGEKEDSFVALSLSSSVRSCLPKSVLLGLKDFAPASRELHKEQEKKPAVLKQY